MKLFTTLSMSVAVLCVGSVAVADVTSTNSKDSQIQELMAFVKAGAEKKNENRNIPGRGNLDVTVWERVQQDGRTLADGQPCTVQLKVAEIGEQQNFLAVLVSNVPGERITEAQVSMQTSMKTHSLLPDDKEVQRSILNLPQGKSLIFNFTNITATSISKWISEKTESGEEVLVPRTRPQIDFPVNRMLHNVRLEWNHNASGRIVKVKAIDMENNMKEAFSCVFPDKAKVASK